MKVMAKKITNDTPITVGILNDAIYTILNGVDNMFKDVAKKDDLQKVSIDVKTISKKVDKLEKDMSEVKNDIHWIKDDINGIKADLSDTPSRKEFIELKDRVDSALM